MIKRRFYKLERGDQKDEPSGSSSSSEDESFESGKSCPTSSGYDTEDSSANHLDFDSSRLPINDEDDESGDELQVLGDNQLLNKRESIFLDKQLKQAEENELLSTDFPDCVLKCKSVFKCRLCPRIVCLNEESLRAHLLSKRHSRSEKLLNEGRLKPTLDSVGEDEDTLTKEDVEIEAVSQGKRKREKGGRQRQHRRRQNKELKRKKVKRDSDVVNTRSSKESPTKKRHKRKK